MSIETLNSNYQLSEHLALPSEATLGHSNELDGSHLSPHFTLGEFTKSNYPEVYNVPTYQAIENMKRICGWLEELRDRYNAKYDENSPIIINSGYRSPQLNKRVGGVSTSNHVTGCAVDIRCYGIEQAIRYATILMDYADESKEEFDELFIEKNKYGRYWVHFAVRPKDNRRKISFLNGNYLSDRVSVLYRSLSLVTT